MTDNERLPTLAFVFPERKLRSRCQRELRARLDARGRVRCVTHALQPNTTSTVKSDDATEAMMRKGAQCAETLPECDAMLASERESPELLAALRAHCKTTINALDEAHLAATRDRVALWRTLRDANVPCVDWTQPGDT